MLESWTIARLSFGVSDTSWAEKAAALEAAWGRIEGLGRPRPDLAKLATARPDLAGFATHRSVHPQAVPLRA